MVRVLHCIILTGMVLSVAACGDLDFNQDNNSSSTANGEEGSPTGSEEGGTASPLQVSALKVIQLHCAACHGPSAASGGVGNLIDVQYLIDTGLIVIGDASQGRLVGSIEDGSMPPGNRPVPPADLQTIKDWINSGQVSTGGGMPSAPVLEAKFSNILQNILLPKCVVCHGPDRADEGVRVDSFDQVMNGDLVRPGNPNGSELFLCVNNGEMPPAEDGYAPLSAEEKQVIFDWIADGALNN